MKKEIFVIEKMSKGQMNNKISFMVNFKWDVF